MSDYLKKRERERKLEKIRGKARNGNGNGNGNGKRARARSADDDNEHNTVHNLQLYTENTGELYPAMQDVRRTLLRAVKQGRYDRDLGRARFATLLKTKAARMYRREWPDAPRYGAYPFSPEVIEGAADSMAEDFEAAAGTGEYDYLIR